MFDNVCKFLAETFSTDFATWLLDQGLIQRILRQDIMKESVRNPMPKGRGLKKP
ncbi:hypothetical protein [Scytonema sp. PRP1]|uniref:hypothetical protein n=1 Tax=Scytonema sp. PRP1 TaxID=3120513 RepID=UPI002FD3538C